MKLIHLFGLFMIISQTTTHNTTYEIDKKSIYGWAEEQIHYYSGKIFNNITNITQGHHTSSPVFPNTLCLLSTTYHYHYVKEESPVSSAHF